MFSLPDKYLLNFPFQSTICFLNLSPSRKILPIVRKKNYGLSLWYSVILCDVWFIGQLTLSEKGQVNISGFVNCVVFIATLTNSTVIVKKQLQIISKQISVTIFQWNSVYKDRWFGTTVFQLPGSFEDLFPWRKVSEIQVQKHFPSNIFPESDLCN